MRPYQDFVGVFRELLCGIRVGAFACLQELVKTTCLELAAPWGGIIIKSSGRPLEIGEYYSDGTFANTVLRSPPFGEWLARTGIKLRTWDFWVDAPRESLNEGEVVLVRLPTHYPLKREGLDAFVVFVHPNCDDEPGRAVNDGGYDLLASLVETWAWRMSHHRAVFENACDSLLRAIAKPAGGEEEDRQVAEHLKQIDTCWKCLGRHFNERDLVRVVRIATHYRGRQEVRDFPSRIKSKGAFHCCVLPHWPTCRVVGNPGPRLLPNHWGTVAFWAQFRDQVPPNANRKTMGKNLDALCRYTQKVSPRENLLPNGLEKYAFSRILQASGPDREGGRPDHWLTAAQSPDQLATLTSAISCVSEFLFASAAWDDKTIEGVLWLLSEYAHDGLGIPYRIDLHECLLQAAKDEPALHTMTQYYRDHFFHALEVCHLGHFLLDLEIAPGLRLWQVVQKHLPGAGAKPDVLRQWYLASLLHDVGYSVDVLKSTKGMLGFFSASKTLKGIVAGLDACLKGLSGKMKKLDHWKKMGLKGRKVDNPAEDHGIWGAEHPTRKARRPPTSCPPSAPSPCTTCGRKSSSRKTPSPFCWPCATRSRNGDVRD
ncbi:MAG: hypothetical protein NTV86_04250 [Planctomycetota bacterium]|nr:hypothetical protein [Planctomycetota bacterium]